MIQESCREYYYETHLHTSEGSACGRSTAEQLIEAYARAGYAGVVVTDHFFNGNCAVPAGLPWSERVDLFCRGYENALVAGGRHDLTVFFGWEFNYRGSEFLTYGLDKSFLLDHPDLHQFDIIKYLETVRTAGGLVSQAHPFRQRDYIDRIRLLPRFVDAAEIYNPGDRSEWNELAAAYAGAYGLAYTAGSDMHCAESEPGSGMAFDHRLASAVDFIESVKRREARILRPA